MPDSHDDSSRKHRPTDPARRQPPADRPRQHDPFVVDTRRTKGNRRAAPPRQSPPGPQSTRQAIPTRGARPLRPDGAAADRSTPAGTSRPVRDGSGASRAGVRRVSTRDGDVYVGGPGIHREDGSPAGPGTPGRAGTPTRRRRWRKPLAILLVLVLLWMAGLVWAGTSAWDEVTKVDAIPQHVAESGAGTNTLIVGSDGREGLTAAQRRALGTGQDQGQRTDSIMVLHTGGPKPTLMSIPRDSYVAIPGHAKNKINASFSIGGPQLLIQTIEQNTGIHIDNYMEIGFAGFASVVDAVGGVRICVPRDMDDKKAHINLKKGCQTLNGPNALGYVRARYSDPEGDIGRAKRQRQFLGALMKKISSPANLLVPWRLKGLGESGAQGLSVDKNMSALRAMRIMWTLKGFSSNSGNSVVIPIATSALPTTVGEAVEWDATRAEELFKAMRDNGDTSPFVKASTAATTSGAS